MDQKETTGNMTESIVETAIYTMLLSQALFEILEERGLVTRDEVTNRMKKLESTTAFGIWCAKGGTSNPAN